MTTKQNIITSDGIKLYIERSGKGASCIYLHGGPGYWSKSFQHFAGDHVEEDLEMVYLDQRGCGRSAHDPNKNYSLIRLIEDIEEVREQLGITEWYLMGHSFGGVLAINYAYQYPEKVTGIILSNVTLDMIDSFGHQIKKGQEMLRKESSVLPVGNLSAFMNIFYELTEELLSKGMYYRLQYRDYKNVGKMAKVDKGLASDPSFQQYIFSTEEYFQDFSKLTAGITHPVLIVTGEHDHAVGPDHHRKFNFSDKQVCVLDNGHHPYIENPLVLKTCITKFVKREPKL